MNKSIEKIERQDAFHSFHSFHGQLGCLAHILVRDFCPAIEGAVGARRAVRDDVSSEAVDVQLAADLRQNGFEVNMKKDEKR